MKLIKVHQILDPYQKVFMVTELWLNKDIIRWAHLSENKHNILTYTTLTLIGNDKSLNILETPDELNDLCKSVAEVTIVGQYPLGTSL